MQREGSLYTILFAAMVCGVCSILVSGAAVGLKKRQVRNQLLERQKKVLAVTGLMGAKERLSAIEVGGRFEDSIEPRVVPLETGEYDEAADPKSFNQRRAAKDPATSKAAPANKAKVLRLPNQALVYLVKNEDAVDQIVIPVEGKGLWSTLYGYLSLDRDTTTIKGITFYEHGETPGLGGEIDNPRWKALWQGRKAYDEQWEPNIRVIKGQAGSPEEDPHRVDGLSGATLTGRGVENLLALWLSDDGFGPYLARFRERGS